MTILANLTIAAPVTAAVTSPMQFAGASAFVPSSLVLEASFTYGSGGTSVSAWVQTSFDDQLTWSDIAFFSFATASAQQAVAVVPAGVTTALALTDGTASSTVSGFLGPLWRVKYSSVGTYAATTLRIDASGPRTIMSPI